MLSMAKLISKSKEMLGVTKRKQKAQHFEFSTDPVTGFRSNTGPYSDRSKKGRPRALWLQTLTASSSVEHSKVDFL